MRTGLGQAFSAAALTICCVTSAWADGGLVLREDSLNGPRWQGRIGLGNAVSPGLRPELQRRDDTMLGSLSVMGDYYLSGPLLGRGLSGGLRATGGLLVGPRSALLSNPALPSNQLSPFSLSRLAGGVPPPGSDGNDLGSAPYLGIGYSGMSVKRTLSFSADFGLAATSPGSGLRFGRFVPGSPSFDDMLHELRLTPVIQLGLSYTF